MSKLTPKQIFDDFKSGEMDQTTAINYLKSIIDVSESIKIREKSLLYLIKIDTKTQNLYKILEQLLLSDENESIKNIAAEEIVNNYLLNGEKALNFVFKYETSPICLLKIYKLFKSEENESKQELLASMINKFGKYFIKKFHLIPEEAFFLEVLRRDVKRRNIEIYINKESSSGGEFYYHIYTKGANIVELYCRDDFPDSDILKNFKNLKKLHIFSEGSKNYRGLRKLTQLDVLVLEDTIFDKKEDLKFLTKLFNLKELHLICTTIKEIAFLEALVNLEKLSITGCDDSGWRGHISEIKGLKNLKNLRHLNLNLNQISEIQGLDSLVNLKRLELSENKIRDINGLENLINLEVLDLSKNKIRELKNLENLESLKYLYMDENYIPEEELKKFIKKIDVISN